MPSDLGLIISFNPKLLGIGAILFDAAVQAVSLYTQTGGHFGDAVPTNRGLTNRLACITQGTVRCSKTPSSVRLWIVER